MNRKTFVGLFLPTLKLIYFCAMTEQLTPKEAWSDFALWLPLQDRWKVMSRSEKQALDKTTRMVANGKAGMRRITSAFNKYAPGRYNFHQKEWVTKNEQ